VNIELTPEQEQDMQVKIAELDGGIWTKDRHGNRILLNAVIGIYIVDMAGSYGKWSVTQCPDYTQSRDAIVGAILRRFVTRSQRHYFTGILCEMLYPSSEPDDVREEQWRIATASPIDLCRAYLEAAK